MNNALTIADAHTIAARWVAASGIPFTAAFLSGSSVRGARGAPYTPDTDIDCYLILDGPQPAGKIGKIRVESVVLDISSIAWESLAFVESDVVLASLLNFGKIITDRDGRLTALQQQVSSQFANPDQIGKRIQNMAARIHSGLSVDSPHLPHPEQIMNWLFPATLATHIPLIAACAPLTVRKRFLAARAVMNTDDYYDLLSLYGFADISPTKAQYWLDHTARLFDATMTLAEESSRFWAGDIRDMSRDIAIGGSQKMIDEGIHREALYWLIATSCRCLVVRHDAGAASEPYLSAFDEMTNRLAITTREQRRDISESILKWVDNWAVPY